MFFFFLCSFSIMHGFLLLFTSSFVLLHVFGMLFLHIFLLYRMFFFRAICSNLCACAVYLWLNHTWFEVFSFLSSCFNFSNCSPPSALLLQVEPWCRPSHSLMFPIEWWIVSVVSEVLRFSVCNPQTSYHIVFYGPESLFVIGFVGKKKLAFKFYMNKLTLYPYPRALFVSCFIQHLCYHRTLLY